MSHLYHIQDLYFINLEDANILDCLLDNAEYIIYSILPDREDLPNDPRGVFGTVICIVGVFSAILGSALGVGLAIGAAIVFLLVPVINLLFHSKDNVKVLKRKKRK